MSLSLPADLVKGDVTRTASTASEFWTLRYAGFQEVEGPATASLSYEELTPAQKRARTLAAKKDQDSVDTSSEAVDADLTNQAGDANPDA